MLDKSWYLVVAMFSPALALSVLSIPAHAEVEAGDFLVVDYDAAGGGGALYHVRPGETVDIPLSVGQYFRDPVDVVCDPGGRIFVADGTAAAIIEVDPLDGTQRLVAQGGYFVSPVGITTGTGNDLWVCDSRTKSVVRVDKDSGTQYLYFSGSPLVSPFRIARDQAAALYVMDRTAMGSGAVFRVQDTGATLVSLGQFFTQLADIAVTSGDPGSLYAVNRYYSQFRLISVDLSDRPDSNQTVVEYDVRYSSAPMAVDAGTTVDPPVIYLLSDLYSRARIAAIDLQTGNETWIAEVIDSPSPFGFTICPEAPAIQVRSATWGRIKHEFR